MGLVIGHKDQHPKIKRSLYVQGTLPQAGTAV